MQNNYDVLVEELKNKHLSKNYKDNKALIDNYTSDLFVLLTDFLKDFIPKQEE